MHSQISNKQSELLLSFVRFVCMVSLVSFSTWISKLNYRRKNFYIKSCKSSQQPDVPVPFFFPDCKIVLFCFFVGQMCSFHAVNDIDCEWNIFQTLLATYELISVDFWTCFGGQHKNLKRKNSASTEKVRIDLSILIHLNAMRRCHLRAYEFEISRAICYGFHSIHGQIEILRDFLTCRRFNFGHRNVLEMSEKWKLSTSNFGCCGLFVVDLMIII